MSDFTYRPQQVDYLGFLEAQLRDLQGVDRLAYELIQNADDVQAADGAGRPTRLTFDVTDAALVVENDGVFRPVDFQRMQRIAGGGKRQEAGTTGAFGLGFIAVYQVTDAPEIYSANLHWTIHPQAPPEKRIVEREAQTSGTRFVLPWAFEANTAVRRALRMEAVDHNSLDALAGDLARAIGLAALFLRQLTMLEVRRNGELVQRIERDMGDQRLLLRDATGAQAAWLVFGGDFAEVAAGLRQTFGGQIEAQRHSDVTIAVPTGVLPAQGRLFAVLPTEATMPLPLHINADFFPTTDRRHVHFQDGYQARWNEAALRRAAALIARHLHDVRQTLAPQDFWHVLQGARQTQQRAQDGELPGAFGSFWQALAPHLRQEPIIYTADGRWLPPDDVRLAPTNSDAALLQALGVAVVHRGLSPYAPLMRQPEVGVQALSLADVSQALHKPDLRAGTTLDQGPDGLRTLDAWRRLWMLVDELLGEQPRHEQEQTVRQTLGDVPLVPDEAMALRTLRRIYRGDGEAQALFPTVAWINPVLNIGTFPARFVTRFGARQAVEHLALQTEEQLQEAWRMGHLDLPRLFRWFESQQIEILADDPALKGEILSLPLCPIEGQLRPLGHLYIPGGFEDPLGLAGVVDLQAIGGRRQFLQDLGMQELDFQTYVHVHIPRVLEQHPDLASDARHELMQLLARRLGQIRDDGDLRERLRGLPLVACMDGSFRAAQEVYVSRETARLAGPRAHIAEAPESDALAALHRWLGVRREPATGDLVQRLRQISAEQRAWGQPLADADLSVVLECWERLQEIFAQGRLAEETLAQLRQGRTLPNHARMMSKPGRLLFLDDADLAARFAGAEDGGDLDRYLLILEEWLPDLMASAGVRPFSAAVQRVVVGKHQAAPAPHIERRLHERLPLIARLVQAEEGSPTDEAGDDPLQALRNLRVLQLSDLQIRLRLAIDPQDLETAAQAQAAAYVAGEHALYVESGDRPPAPAASPWTAIARELALILKGPGGGAGLALGIREVLAAGTFDAAAQVLDELGYP